MSENDPYRRDQYKSTKKAALVTMLLSTQDRERDLNARLQSSTDEQGRMASKRQADEAKIHQLRTALDAAARARTSAASLSSWPAWPLTHSNVTRRPAIAWSMA